MPAALRIHQLLAEMMQRGLSFSMNDQYGLHRHGHNMVRLLQTQGRFRLYKSCTTREIFYFSITTKLSRQTKVKKIRFSTLMGVDQYKY